MVDKVDRPEARTPYRINEPTHAKGNQPQGGGQQQEEANYQQEKEQKEWGKFHATQLTIKPVRVAREKLRACYFNYTTIRQGVPLLVADLAWANGQTTEGAHFILPRHEDFLKLRAYRRGQEVPDAFWAHSDEVEIGIPELHGTSGKFRVPNFETSPSGRSSSTAPPPWAIALGLIDAATRKIRWGFILGLLFVMTIGFLVIMQAV